MNQPDAILVSDIHLRGDKPLCRTDNFLFAQAKKLRWLKRIQRRYNCPILNAGDLFNKAKPGEWVLGEALRELPDGIITIPGQHDLPNHSMDIESYNKSGMNILELAGKIEVLERGKATQTERNTKNYAVVYGLAYGQAYGQEPNGFPLLNNFKRILLLHTLCWIKEPFPGAPPSGNAVEILKEYPDFDLIVTGDNHQAFTVEYNGKLLVNPGSMMRSTASQINFKPRFYLWYANENRVEEVYFPIDPKAVTREHIEEKQERNERIEAFITRLESNVELGLNFEKNLTKYIHKNEINKETEKIIWEIINECI